MFQPVFKVHPAKQALRRSIHLIFQKGLLLSAIRPCMFEFHRLDAALEYSGCSVDSKFTPPGPSYLPLPVNSSHPYQDECLPTVAVRVGPLWRRYVIHIFVLPSRWWGFFSPLLPDTAPSLRCCVFAAGIHSLEETTLACSLPQPFLIARVIPLCIHSRFVSWRSCKRN